MRAPCHVPPSPPPLSRRFRRRPRRRRSPSPSNSPAATDEHLAALHFLFERHFAKAAQLVDAGGVFAFTAARSRRRVHQVAGRRGAERHTVLPAHYCSCQAFFFDVASKGEAAACKHQLAARLAEALGRARETEVPDLVVAEILQS